MGLFDLVILPDLNDGSKNREGKVRCWKDYARVYCQGDNVPLLKGQKTYNVRMDEGGYLNVVACRLISWTDHRNFAHVFDKDGNPLGNQVEVAFVPVVDRESDYT